MMNLALNVVQQMHLELENHVDTHGEDSPEKPFCDWLSVHLQKEPIDAMGG